MRTSSFLVDTDQNTFGCGRLHYLTLSDLQFMYVIVNI